MKRVLRIFGTDPHHPSLHNHALRGVMEGLRSFSVTGEVRIVFFESDGYAIVIFLAIGSHEQVYE